MCCKTLQVRNAHRAVVNRPFRGDNTTVVTLIRVSEITVGGDHDVSFEGVFGCQGLAVCDRKLDQMTEADNMIFSRDTST